jgi:glutathione peroxidase
MFNINRYILITLFLLIGGNGLAINAYDFSFTSIDGESQINLSEYKGKTILVVNTASLCGFTYQYDGLQSLYDNYGDDGLVVLGIPANDFSQQEPGQENEIKEFCETNFNITFPMTSKEIVKGKGSHPFFDWTRDELGFLDGVPRWNFHKIIIDKNGNAIGGYTPLTKPSSKRFIKVIEKALKI